jgi:glycosyltransferase involved in cell wall biosynthesis
MKKLTIGIPAYNKTNSLIDALNSLIRQTYIDFTVIVSDDSDLEIARENELKIKEIGDSRISYTKQEVRLGLFPNMQYVLDRASSDYFLWLCDDDVIEDASFLKDAVHMLENNSQLALVGYRAERFLNGKYWYSYLEYSSVGKTQLERCKEIIKYQQTDSNIFETLQYGVHRLSMYPKNFELGYRKSIIVNFYVLSLKGELHTLPSQAIKNTTYENLESYKSKEYIVKHPLSFLGRVGGSIFVRIRMIYYTFIESNIKARDKVVLIFNILTISNKKKEHPIINDKEKTY